MKSKLTFILTLSIIFMSFKDPIITWGTSQNGLAMALTGYDENIEVHFKNEGQKILQIWSYVDNEVGEKHFDWFTLELIDEKGNKFILKDPRIEKRKESGYVFTTLDPNKDFSHSINIKIWCKEISEKLRGKYKVSLIYYVKDKEDDKWHGTIKVINHPIIIN